jgi:hypothetical protein
MELVTKNDFAKAILTMNYGTLKTVCAELATANEDKECRPKLETAEEFADLLYDWAEATHEEEKPR